MGTGRKAFAGYEGGTDLWAELSKVPKRDQLLAQCARLLRGQALTLAAADLEAALPAGERPPGWTAVGELYGLLSDDPELRIAEDLQSGAVTVLRAVRAAADRPLDRIESTLPLRRRA